MDRAGSETIGLRRLRHTAIILDRKLKRAGCRMNRLLVLGRERWAIELANEQEAAWDPRISDQAHSKAHPFSGRCGRETRAVGDRISPVP
jgi:hypothetical protein